MSIEIFFIVGVEGCGHHALTPAIHASFSHNMKKADSGIEISQPGIRQLNQAFRELWYSDHKSEQHRTMAREKITAILKTMKQEAIACKKSKIIILDNSFPSVGFRTTDKQWDLEEFAEITSPHANIHLLGLYRNPIATTFSHRDWDGGFRNHALVISTFLEYLHEKLIALDKYDLRIIHYEDLVNRTSEFAAPLSKYLGIDQSDVSTGLNHIKKSEKDWRNELSSIEKSWALDFFSGGEDTRWSIFLKKSRNILQ